ncbi:hypothetical protein GF325_03370 [Candidatus Bathyarchaeota archaeon]|nr:hypothetical protein [Candidatus Bathyarchaeota archaeon]
MLKFTNCPKCNARIEDQPGTPCWNCGFLIPSEKVGENAGIETPGEQVEGMMEQEIQTLDDTAGVKAGYFKPCPNCNANVEYFSVKCWNCGVVLTPTTIDGEIPIDWDTAPKKEIPFEEIASKPPESPKKQGIAEKIINVFKPDYKDDYSTTHEEKQEERRLKKKRKLILFHCPRCGEYFKVLFKKVKENVKCPECKTARMKISYFCTRCKKSKEFFTLDRHVCDQCKLDMILDPNFE